MTEKEKKLTAIQSAIKSFATDTLTDQAISLFRTLGYNTQRQNPFTHKTFAFFKESFLDGDSRFNEEKALTKEWKSVDLLFQLSKDELSNQKSLFGTGKVKWEGEDKETVIETYLFFALELAKAEYTRTALAQITRQINKVFPMPAMIVFKYGKNLTLSVINRRLHKKDERKDVLEKVTLIKDISIQNPHRAHIEILFDLSFEELKQEHKVTNFVELHNAWQKTLDTKELNKKFLQEISHWYFWAMEHVSFPADVEKNAGIRNATNLIRLITRIIFIWFIREKNLVPQKIFDRLEISKILRGFYQDKKSHNYYLAILQNLFFGTLNQKMGARKFAQDGGLEDNKIEYGIKTLFRYLNLFAIAEKEALNLFEDVPFLNGGLFDCLDKEDDAGKVFYVDGFSRNPQKQALVPDFLFFGDEDEYDLNQIYDTRNKSYQVKGLFNILSGYKFTITENTPVEEEVALDPELLGKVFENLLASYNPETQTTARKQTGSFYTPREIVSYMVAESLKAYLKQKLITEAGMDAQDADVALGFLFEYNEMEHLFDGKQTDVLIKAIDNCKILDPACGSAAFPMGALHSMVHILHKLDPNNEKWKECQIKKLDAIEDSHLREQLIADIESAFEHNELDYGRKLYLIENCIYGVDIQPIAIQISKLRFFISLIVDQKVDRAKENLGIRSLPNLEAKFVAANTLIGLEKPQQMPIKNPAIGALEKELKELRHKYFSEKTRKGKLDCQRKDKDLRKEISTLLVIDGWGSETAKQVAAFDPYSQNASSAWFDPEWMFGITDGFDIVLGNPPYLNTKRGIDEISLYRSKFKSAQGQFDIFSLFIEYGLTITKNIMAYIVPKPFINNENYQIIREMVLENCLTRVVIGSNVFESAGVESCVFVLTHTKEKEPIHILNFEAGEFHKVNVIDQRIFSILPFRIINTELSDRDIEIYQRLNLNSTPFGSLVDIARGVECGKNDNTITRKKNNYPLLRGEDVSPYASRHNDLYINFDPKDTLKFKPYSIYSGDKILIRRVADNLIATFDNAQYVVLNTVYCCVPRNKSFDGKFLVGLINSKLLKHWFKKAFVLTDKLFPYIRKSQLEFLPILTIAIKDKSLQLPVINLVNTIIADKMVNPDANTRVLEAEIDQLVYQLYGLTEEEIAIVEGSTHKK